MDLKTVHQGVHRRKRRKRVGRGPGSKRGRYATVGSKGQRQHSGDLPALLKEGGQMPLFRRLPKRGFNNRWKTVFAVVNVADLANFEAGTQVTTERLESSGLAKRPHDQIKILGDGELDRGLEVHAHAFSQSARQKIEQAGGTCVLVATPHRGPKVRRRRPKRPAAPTP